MASEPFRKIRFPSAPGRTRLLLCDNHSSHDKFEFYEYCLANSIALFFLPSHATHVLQRLDVGVFAPLDRYSSQEVDGWTASQPIHTPLTKADFFPMCEQDYKTSGLHGASVVSCHCAITAYHSPVPDQVTSHEPATPLGGAAPLDGCRKTDRDGRPSQEGGVAKGKERMGMDGGESLDGGLPDVATGRDLGRRGAIRNHVESHVGLGSRGKPIVAVRSIGVEKHVGMSRREGRQVA